MKFTPKPENCFNEFIETYYNECRNHIPKIEAIAGKWEYRDLLPGMSDFDTRFICSDDMSIKDWCDMSTAVGEIHLELCRSFPEWARILEHLPGVNPTWSELTDDNYYYPEYNQWSIYKTTKPLKLRQAELSLSRHKWDDRDEYYFLKKFLSFYGPYNRSIDPPVNMGLYENKYPLHSRLMHYFCPPVQAAVSIINKKAVRGKFTSLEVAFDMFPGLTVIPEIIKIVETHYETPDIYTEPEISKLEKRLEEALDILFESVKSHLTIIPKENLTTVSDIKKALSGYPVSPLMKMFDSSRFCRLFKGRLHFYANAPGFFDSEYLIGNELSRCGDMFYRDPYRIYWQAVTGEPVTNADEIVKKLTPVLLTTLEAEATIEFGRLCPGTWEAGAERAFALEIIPIFDDVFKGLEKIKINLEGFLGKR